ncbi:MAG TPA: glycerol-3-phosphate 1-O-acyltransferase PlsY [Candidatus Acidoferrales bacterium]|nr:glycerol-3-phosphate 1-O-acyltransferase PlsY [Candidatus Acidoferrales bacterium]
MNQTWLIPVIAYFLGAIPFGFLIVKVRGRDIRETGSGNIGAANVARNAGAVAGVLTLILDAGKGYLAVWIAARWTHSNERWMMAAALAAVIGHMFPFWLRFKGGKGVATGLGVFLPIAATAVLAAVVLWILVVLFWRYSSLGSILASVALPIFVHLLYAPLHAPPPEVTVGTILISILVLVKHRGNIERLMNGTESRLRFRR